MSWLRHAKKRKRAYNDEYSGDDLSNNGLRVILTFDHEVKRFRENNDAFTEDNKGEQATFLVDVGRLEANAVPYASTNEHHDNLQEDNNKPSNIGSFRNRPIERKG